MTEVLAEKSLAHLVDDMIQVRFELDGSTDRGWKDATRRSRLWGTLRRSSCRSRPSTSSV